MATSEANKQAAMRYEREHLRTVRCKLHKEHDKDILDRLAEVDSMQGYIKRLIREDIARRNESGK